MKRGIIDRIIISPILRKNIIKKKGIYNFNLFY